jgi:hypothetical protein
MDIQKDIKLGRKIVGNVFEGNPYRQLALIRKSIWALAVLNNNIESTEEEKTLANEILTQSIDIDKEISKYIPKTE